MHFLLDLSADNPPVGLPDLFILKPEISLHLSGNDYEFISWGDPICTDTFRAEFPVKRSVNFIINNLYGHYYYILYDRNTRQFCAGNSLFSILPLYYIFSNGRLLMSDNAFTLGRYTGRATFSKRFILESVLFNYPLFNHSVIEGISLLSPNSGISLDPRGIKITKHTSIQDFFYLNPSPIKKSAGPLTDIFLETVKKYFPKEHYFTALTGGFDGRTLTAAGRYHERSFSCYCFGTSASNDLKLAYEVASKAGIPFFAINLDDVYLKDHSLDEGRNFIISSSGTGTFTRAHYLFAAGQLAGKTRYLLTGNFGSEIFRAAHVPGVLISPNLYTVFSSGNPDEACQKLWVSPGMSWLNKAEMSSVRADLQSDIIGLPCFKAEYKDLSRNRQFYIFVFEELFRKYFGAEMISEAGFIKNRTPFLDIDFLKELLTTQFAGINSRFFEENPFKRYKGQMLYAYILRKTFPQLGKILTDKGYKPDDLISASGIPRLITGYLGKRLKRKNNTYDPTGVKKAWDLNHSFYESLQVNNDLFNTVSIKNGLGSGLTDERAKLYSLIYIDNYLNKLLKPDV